MANIHTTLRGLFSDIADAIREKTGGQGSIVADEFPNAIAEIPTVTLSSLYLAEYPTITNQVLSVKVESSKTHGTKTFSVPVADALPGNIVSGKTILGVTGAAPNLRREHGTVHIVSDTTGITVPCSANPLFIRVFATEETMQDILTKSGFSVVSFYGSAYSIQLDSYQKKIVIEVFNNQVSVKASLSAAAEYENGLEVSSFGSNVILCAGDYEWEAYYNNG